MPGPTPPPPTPPSELALSRWVVVCQVLGLEQQGVVRAEAAREVAQRVHRTLDGDEIARSARTLLRWVTHFERDGIAGLEPVIRARTHTSLVLADDFVTFVREQKRRDVAVSIPELIRRAVELGVVEAPPNRQTVWRACRRMGIPTRRRRAARDRDSRRFAYPHRMDMVLSDGKYFRAGPHAVKRVALFFLDDCTRCGLHVVVGTSECAELFLRGLYELVRRVGLLSILYLDHGPGFIALDTAEVVRNLGALLIHGASRYPEGHGKIERFNRTGKAAVLRSLERPDVDPSCAALELRLQHWLHRIYNHTPHESLDRDTPYERFHADPRALRFPDDLAELRSRFVVHLERTVSNDHVVSVEGVHLEVPRGHAGTRIRILRQVLDGDLFVMHEGRMVRLQPVDLAANARARRASDREPADIVQGPLPPSAADLAFHRDFRPIVDADGGFTSNNEEDR